MNTLIYWSIGLCVFALLLALGKGFFNAGKRWENGERWEIPPAGHHRR